MAPRMRCPHPPLFPKKGAKYFGSLGASFLNFVSQHLLALLRGNCVFEHCVLCIVQTTFLTSSRTKNAWVQASVGLNCLEGGTLRKLCSDEWSISGRRGSPIDMGALE